MGTSEKRLSSDQRFGSECAAPRHMAAQPTDRAVPLVGRCSGSLQPGEIVDVSYGRNTARFIVSSAEPAGANGARIGLQSVNSGEYIWEVEVVRTPGCTRPHTIRLTLPQN